MNKNLFPALAAVILAMPARAIVVASPGASAHAWVAPVAGVFSSVGTERIVTLGMPSLTALSTLDSSARYPFAAVPQVLDRLAAHLKFYATPESFAAMPVEDKLIALRAAAKGAEIEAAAIADEALAAAKSRPLHPNYTGNVSEQIDKAEEVGYYLDAQRLKDVIVMRSKLKRFETKWRKHVEKFQKELPLKIAAGAFDAENILVKTKHGWVAADESPYPIKGDLSNFYERRIEALETTPRGPWTIQEAVLLREALARPDIGGARSWSKPARLQLENIVISASVHSRFDDTPLASAVRAFELNARDGRFVAPRHILAVEKHYMDIVVNHTAPTSLRLRIRAVIRNGAGGLPSWERFREIERSTIGRLRRNSLIAAGVIVAAMIAMIPLGTWFAAWPLVARLAVLPFIWLTPMIVYLRSLWLAQSLDSARDRSYVEETLARTFPND